MTYDPVKKTPSERREITKLRRRATLGSAIIYSSLITFFVGLLLAIGGIWYVANREKIWCDIVVEFANTQPPPTTDRGRALVSKFQQLANELHCNN